MLKKGCFNLFQLRTFLLLTLYLTTRAVFADVTAAEPQALPPDYIACPKISDLHKNTIKMIWFANGGWKSFSPSFSAQIGEFLGAQWQGVNLGNISCIYRGTDQMAFPIILQYNNLVYAPSGGKWTKNLGGYTNCKSTILKDCIFKPKPQPKPGNIYQQASQLKGSHQPEMGY